MQLASNMVLVTEGATGIGALAERFLRRLSGRKMAGIESSDGLLGNRSLSTGL
jgi:short-subunit dehydrogenase involved in D-alanine esterification of teichoic acids